MLQKKKVLTSGEAAQNLQLMLHLISPSPRWETRHTRSKEEPCPVETLCGADVDPRSAKWHENQNIISIIGLLKQTHWKL